MNITHTAGFLFSPDWKRVLLIRKNRPQWMAGKLNAFGGHVEPGESAICCMERETKEETGLTSIKWEPFLLLNSSRNTHVKFFRAFDDYSGMRQLTDEQLVECGVRELYESSFAGCMPNLRWLIPMALGMEREKTVAAFVVTEVAP